MQLYNYPLCPLPFYLKGECRDGCKKCDALNLWGRERNGLSIQSQKLLWVLLMPIPVETLPSVIPARQRKCPIGGHHLSKLGGGWGKGQEEGLCSQEESSHCWHNDAPGNPFGKNGKRRSKQASTASVFHFSFLSGVRAQVLNNSEDVQTNE